MVRNTLLDASEVLHARPANFQPASTYIRTATCTALDEAIVVARASGTRLVILSGPSGSSKTFAARHAAHRLGLPQFLVEISAATAAEDLLERPWTTADGRLVWVEQAVLRAAREGAVVVLDEFDLASPKLLGRLHGLFDTHGSVRLASGEEIVPHPDFLVLACCNGLRRDTGGAYSVQLISSAFLGRAVFVAGDFLSEADEVSIYTAAGYAKETATQVYKALYALRGQFKLGAFTVPPSPRMGLRVLAALKSGLSAERAWSLALCDGLDEKAKNVAVTCLSASSHL